MNAKKLLVSLVTAVTLMLFTGAAYAQQLATPQEDDTVQVSSSHQEEWTERTSNTGRPRCK
jgi:hypothetical protein